VFLKIVYHGPAAMEELATYDPHLVPGILGGSSGTTYDAFKLLEEAKAHGARAALFGRKINNSEDQLTFVRYLRAIANGQIKSEEACRAYHGDLQKLGITPYRPLKEDLELTSTATSYAGSGSTVSLAPPRQSKPAPVASTTPSAPIKTGAKAQAAVKAAVIPKASAETPDFKSMSAAQKVAYARNRIKEDLAKQSNANGR
jgi:hypothetical protein